MKRSANQPISSSRSSSKSINIPQRKQQDSDFERIRVLGRGAFAKVVLVEDRRTKLRYAMKILQKSQIVERNHEGRAMSERQILTSSSHPFICGLRCSFQTKTTLNLVLEYCPGGELFYLLTQRGRFDEPSVRFYAAEISSALSHLHANSVVFRDLKPENLLIDAQGHMKLADFGLSKQGIAMVHSGAFSMCGTPEYLAPEVILQKGHGTAIDWWALGALMYEMLVGQPPWYHENRTLLYQGIVHHPLVFPPEPVLSSEAKHLIASLLEKDPVKRLGSLGVLAHPFFGSIDFRKLEAKEIEVPWLPPQNDNECFDPIFTTENVVNSLPKSLAASFHQLGIDTFSGFSWMDKKVDFAFDDDDDDDL
ncbi:hypothetical protein BASA81_006834 [Batrachochytrium salamandrivorans]|nr:hypothetical protein BASA81_006834 [Batrachochytrium salamandrivorans]